MADEFKMEHDTEYNVKTYPSKTYKIDIDRHCIYGCTDGVDAVIQTVKVILAVDRYKYPIFSWGFGSELTECVGKSIAYVQSEAQRMIVDALSNDDRILSVTDFSFNTEGNTVICQFTVNTIYGSASTEVEI